MPIALNSQPQPLDHLVLRGESSDVALILRGKALTYEELRLRVGQLAAWLTAQVREKGARVASWAAKGELTCLMPLAAARAGLVHVPVNPLLKRAQVRHIVADSGARLLIGTRARLDTLEAADIPAACELWAEEEVMAACSAPCAALAPSQAGADDLAAIMYTSGSTGKPKGVMLSHANLWLGAVSVAHYLKLESDDRTLAVLPLAFDYGQNQLFSTWLAGGCVVPLDYLFARDVVKACAAQQITTLAAVPALWMQLAESEWSEQAAGAVRRLTNSGGALTADLVRALRQLFPQADVYPMYGLTEAFRSTYLDPELVDAHPTSMGKAIPFAEILVVDDRGEPVEAGQEGELVHCGPLVAQGYWRDEERSRERFRPAPAFSEYGGSAVWSGDTVMRDCAGLLYFRGRKDAMIKSAGHRISPQEVEDAALATGLVAEAVALGLEDARLGQAVHLAVRAVQAEPSKSKTLAKALTKALAKQLPNFMQPQAIYWRDAMPLGPNGKIDRAALARALARELSQ